MSIAATAASGLLLALYSRVEAPWFALGWVVFVPWLAAVDRAPSWRAALACGALMSAAFALAVFAWFAAAMSRYSGASPALSLVLLVIAAPLLQPQPIALAAARWWARRRGFGVARTAVVGAAAYVACEWGAGKLLGDTLGHGLYASLWMRQAADLAGAHGLTFALVAGNACALEVLRARRAPARRAARMPAAAIAASVLCLLGYGAWRCRQFDAAAGAARPLRAALIQANIANYERLAAELGTYEAARFILDNHFELSSTAARRQPLDLVVWPETVYPTTFGKPKSAAGAELDGRIVDFAAALRAPLVFGAYEAADGREYNAAIFLDGSRGTARFDTYRKARLFPLTERVPRWLDSARLRRWLPWLGTWQPGAGRAVVPLALADGRTVQVAPLICYDAVEPARVIGAVRQGAELIVTLSNDSWFADSAGARLHFVVAAFLSIETRRPQLRATNTGISAVVDALGRVVAMAGAGERTALLGAVTPQRGVTTLMLRWGDWFGPAAAGLTALLLALPRARRQKSR